ncbi:hypothetical protein ACFX13_030550 [Malus domestica]
MTVEWTLPPNFPDSGERSMIINFTRHATVYSTNPSSRCYSERTDLQDSSPSNNKLKKHPVVRLKQAANADYNLKPKCVKASTTRKGIRTTYITATGYPLIHNVFKDGNKVIVSVLSAAAS